MHEVVYRRQFIGIQGPFKVGHPIRELLLVALDIEEELLVTDA